jgi:hypothetical protein
MVTLFALGTFWFWLLITVAVISIIAITEQEDSNSWHWSILLGLPVLLYFTGCKNEILSLLSYVQENPVTIILGFVGYLFLGTIWSVVKWYLYLTNIREYYRLYPYNFNSNKSKFNAKENKERIVNWMMYWPFSGLWTLINDPIKKSFQRIFTGLENRFQKISDDITKEFNDDSK